jgi:nucleotide-binding universal stress UspA family protein
MIDYPRKVLVATDESEDSVKAAHAALALADRAGAELHVVHVEHASETYASGAAVGHPSYLPGEPPGYAERQARKLLDRQVEAIRGAGGNVTEAHLRMGRPAPEIIALAATLGADLVVVGSGGPHAMRRAVATATHRAAIGSVSGAIVRGAHCPVLVVRGEDALRESRPSEGREGEEVR